MDLLCQPTLLPFLPTEGKEQINAIVSDRFANEAIDQPQSTADAELGSLAKLPSSTSPPISRHDISGLHPG